MTHVEQRWLLDGWLPVSERTMALLCVPISEVMRAYRLRRSVEYLHPFYDGVKVRLWVPSDVFKEGSRP